MEGLILKRLAALAGRVSEGITGCASILEEIKVNPVYTREQQIKVAKLKVAVEKLVGEIQNTVHFSQNESPQLDEKISEYTALQEQAENIIVEVELGLATPKEVGTSSTSHANTTSKLPKLELPPFKGDILQWYQFWDLFKSNIDSRSDLRDVDKLSYLLGFLEGEAKKTIGGLLMTNKNYQIAVQQLSDRYGKPEKIIEAHYKAINKIKPAQNEVGDCRKTFLEIEQHLRILESMNENVNQNNLLRMTVMEKFPTEVKYELQKAVETDGYSMEVIRKSLKKVITAREDSMSLEDHPESSNETGEHFTTDALFSGNNSSTSINRTDQRNRQTNQSSKGGGKGKHWKRRNYKENNGSTQSHVNQDASGSPKKRTKLECIFCQGNHYNDECKKFATVGDRKGQLKGRCFLCFKKQHVAADCKSGAKKCFHCKQVGKHNGSLCPIKFQGKTDSSNTTLVSHTKHDTLLQTAMARISAEKQNPIRARVLFDTGSQKSYISSALATKLKLAPLEDSTLTVFTFGSMKPKHIKTSLVTLRVHTETGNIKELLAYIVPRITGTIRSNSDIKTHIARQHPHIKMAEDAEHDCPAEVLIGSDYYYAFFPGELKQIGDNLFLIRTVLGWIISGKPDEIPPEEIMSFLTYVQGERGKGLNRFTVPDPPLNDDNIKNLWELETIGIKDSPKTIDQDEVIDFFNSTTQFNENRYQVKWPWVEYPTNLPNNYGLALGRLKGLIKRLDENTIQQYDAVLKEQLAKGVIEKIQETARPDSHPVHYLPHHCVIQENRSTKLRIVYDASAKIKGKCSLNEYLYKGPQMLEDLVSLLLRFRLKPVGVTADIEKAFLQIGLQQEDRDVTRFLWIQDISKGVDEENLVHFRFCRVPFGIISSPFLLAATIRFHLAQKNTVNTQLISDSLYVDNLITSVAKPDDARSTYEVARASFDELSMNIREWTSNSTTFMDSVPPDQQSAKKTPSVLGLIWDTERDSLSLAFKKSLLTTLVHTKRDALRIIASIFDPCGFVAPLTLPARLLFQELWKDNYKWDDSLSRDKLNEWDRCASLFRAAAEFSIPRAYSRPSVDIDTPCSHELHCFTDASGDAYAAVVYLRISCGDSHSVSFVMSRSRLTPLRQKEHMTTPKLELLGVLIGTRLVTYVQRVLGLLYGKMFLWTDNQAVLGWLKSDRLLQPFVSNRVAEIKAASNVTFRYISSGGNPADIATRVLKSAELPDLWTKGPSFLAKAPDHWPPMLPPPQSNSPVTPAVSEKEKGQSPLTFCAPLAPGDSTVVSGESTLHPNDPTPFGDPSTPSDVTAIKQLQQQYFPQEVSGKPTDLTTSLRLFIDGDGVLRCGGRLSNADLPFDQKYPILIPRGTNFTIAAIRCIHEQNYHVGVPHTLALVRQRYWIPRGRGEVAKVIRKCERCVKYGGGPFKLPEMPALPKERVASCPPFTYTGLDYLGPLTVRQDGSTQKRWCCLFTCMAVRAIHLELVQDMSAEEFLHCLRRFVASKGVPVVIVSDNAAQFKLTSEVLNAPLCKDNNIQWRFIPELSPWQGGFYERLVGLVKTCLRRTLDKILLADTQLRTVLKEIESVLNTRPLTTVGPEIEHILRPSDFLHPVGTVSLNDADGFHTQKATATKMNLIDSWKRGKAAFNEFQKMFRDQYLTSLRERPVFSHKQPRVVVSRSPRVGEVVQVKDDSRSRAHWKVGVISQLVPSKDGNARTARVTFPDGSSLTRSISHLFPLEVDDETDGDRATQGMTESGETVSPQTNNTSHPLRKTENSSSPDLHAANSGHSSRPQRKAAEAAKEKLKLWTQQLLVRAAAAKETEKT